MWTFVCFWDNLLCIWHLSTIPCERELSVILMGPINWHQALCVCFRCGCSEYGYKTHADNKLSWWWSTCHLSVTAIEMIIKIKQMFILAFGRVAEAGAVKALPPSRKGWGAAAHLHWKGTRIQNGRLQHGVNKIIYKLSFSNYLKITNYLKTIYPNYLWVVLRHILGTPETNITSCKKHNRSSLKSCHWWCWTVLSCIEL